MEKARKQMDKATRELDFFEAARYRDEICACQDLLKSRAED